jgi:phosphonate transport system substrate-binding protein
VKYGGWLQTFVPGILAGLFALTALAQSDCTHRGKLDAMYCDENHDLVADTPKDTRRLKIPSTVMFAYTPVEDQSIYARVFKPFTDYLAKCIAKKVAYLPVQSNAGEIEAMRSGRLHIAGFATGPTGYAVNIAGAVPFAVAGTEQEFQGYHLILIVRNGSPFTKPADLKGKRVAHTSPSSNSGHVAPMALFPVEGLVPDKDYKIIFSGLHDESVMGVLSGNYDAAAVASDVLQRMIVRGQIRENELRVIYRSPRFPTSSFAYAHDLEPAFRDRMLKCFFDFRFPDSMKKSFDGADRFFPITYQKEWEIIRRIAESGGGGFNRAAYEKEIR